jgi:hypothetical protein
MNRGHIRGRGKNSFELKYDVAHEDGGRRTVYKSFKGAKRKPSLPGCSPRPAKAVT